MPIVDKLEVACPFYKRHYSNAIACEGVTSETAEHYTQFVDAYGLSCYMMKYCCNLYAYKYCKHYQKVYNKYLGGTEDGKS